MASVTSTDTPTIAIIGGGLSGSLVALQLLRQARGSLRIIVIDRAPPLGRGVAYSTECPDHLLNVPAARLSALPEEPEHFVRWMQARVGRTGFPSEVAPTDFLPRQLYGDYVYQVLKEAREQSPPEVKLETIAGEAVDIEEVADGTARITLVDARTFSAHRVVLALGNLPGEYPIKRSLRFYHGPRYVHIPWKADMLSGIRADDEVLIVGAGLTAIDIILQLESQGHRGKIHALSRRGLRPQAHKLGPVYPPFLDAASLPKTVSGAVHRVRSEIRRAAAAGVDWRAVIDSLRPFTQTIWREWSWEQRARFMRHLRPYWETHRHRLAPQVAARIEAAEKAGRVEFYAGRLESLKEVDGAAEAVFRRRGAGELQTLRVGKVINCTGPRTDYSKYQHPLLINLLARGLIDHDPLALGLHATPQGDVFRYRGEPSGWLFTLGAPLKGVLWECTAVPEIRTQARALAQKLVSLFIYEPHESLPETGR
jgi:uncharacterized NAD(P)/FAD-binding protein YdhS